MRYTEKKRLYKITNTKYKNRDCVSIMTKGAGL